MRGFEPPNSASQTTNFVPKIYQEINKVNLTAFSNWYIADRINTRRLTQSSQVTIKNHFRRLIRDFDTIPDSIQLSEWLGRYSPCGRKRLFETFRAFGRWLEKKKVMPNPWSDIDVPKVPIPILKAPSCENIRELFAYLEKHYPPDLALRNKAIIAVFVESGLRLFELTSIKPEHINWSERTIQVWGKGRKEGKAPFGQTSEVLLKDWLSRYNPNGDNIWGIDKAGIQMMLKRLHQATNITCNPHSFRRAFAAMLLKSGVDSLDIKRLGRWQNLDMVDRYCRSVQFEDSLKFYKAPLS